MKQALATAIGVWWIGRLATTIIDCELAIGFFTLLTAGLLLQTNLRLGCSQERLAFKES
ncbi:hypothetical protein NKJ90_21385 [Mesorhizobium sp. M0051]|uniref:hypothetical protein n=1 Tax=unclassified Mesorhizobium TaxID=325217 RepID=UPI0003CEA936|nr:hypothetical protein [Mesorhizobium sp. LNHC252B00]ESY75067.1 hypothetical protein X743_06465 [Mesorhizobium sp. LNHC252B00]